MMTRIVAGLLDELSEFVVVHRPNDTSEIVGGGRRTVDAEGCEANRGPQIASRLVCLFVPRTVVGSRWTAVGDGWSLTK
jgi:hypothetical protein